MSRAVRFARTLALLTGGASISCGSEPREPTHVEDAAPAADVATHEASKSPTAMSCVEAEEQTNCTPGSVCHVDTDYGFLRCDVPDSGVNKPCGAIKCGWLCACTDPVESTCECYGGAGPLPPPDLPLR